MDGLGRLVAQADYGTNGDSALTRPSTIPARSDDVLVDSTEYDDGRNVQETVDPAGKRLRREYDDAGREVRRIDNYTESSSSSSSSGASDDANATVETSYRADGQISTLTALNSATGDQVTTYVYGTTLSDSDIARSALLRAEIYPDSDDAADPLGDGADGTYDRVEYKYNRQGQPTEKKDQNGTAHAFDYDGLGRRTQDRVTTVGAGVDGAVRVQNRDRALAAGPRN